MANGHGGDSDSAETIDLPPRFDSHGDPLLPHHKRHDYHYLPEPGVGNNGFLDRIKELLE